VYFQLPYPRTLLLGHREETETESTSSHHQTGKFVMWFVLANRNMFPSNGASRNSRPAHAQAGKAV
jgi:hypothetical protein